MDAVHLIALTMGVAWASGLNLYAAVFMLGERMTPAKILALVREAGKENSRIWRKTRLMMSHSLKRRAKVTLYQRSP